MLCTKSFSASFSMAWAGPFPTAPCCVFSALGQAIVTCTCVPFHVLDALGLDQVGKFRPSRSPCHRQVP